MKTLKQLALLPLFFGLVLATACSENCDNGNDTDNGYCNDDNNNDNGGVPIIPVAGVMLTPADGTSLFIGNAMRLTVTVLPDSATNKTVTWQSIAPGVAPVSNAVVTGLAEGIANIVATTEDGSFTATSAVTVGTFRCNSNTPGFGASLGTVSFHSQGHNVVISGNGITQTWSGAVTATNCQKTTFAGGTTNNFNADCRSNPNFPGDLFSWCAVVRFAGVLCPYPWRIPTAQDFRDLDIAMGGTGSNQGPFFDPYSGAYDPVLAEFVQNNYITRWGGSFGGLCTSVGTLSGQGHWSSYWSQSEYNATNGRSLYFDVGYLILPGDWRGKNVGLTLRCVR